MEDDDPNQQGSASETLDPALQKKHHDMLERLSARHQARKSDSSDTSSSSSTLESTSSFLTRFSNSKRSIESRIAGSRLVVSSSADSSKLKVDLAEISFAIDNLEKLLAENSYFLPSYEVRSSLKAVSDLKQCLENLTVELVPKKKFSFKTKSSSKKPESKLPEILKSEVVLAPKLPVRDSPGFRNKDGETLVKKFKGSSIGEFTLSDLDSCQVRLTGTVNALFLHRLKNCNVYTGPVIGSILIDDVEDCVLVLASHQIRIHCAKKSDFYLRVRSRPIIEDSNGVRFAPYCLEYEGIEEDLRTAGLAEETNNWANVDDFRWLRAVQSPNWSVLPEEERVSSVSISGGGDGDSSL